MKGRVRRCTIEGRVPKIKTKNYISYLEPFLIWFCEKEQHKEGEWRTMRGGRADSSRTVCGGRADSSWMVCGGRAHNSWTVCEGRAGSSWTVCGGRAGSSRTVRGGRADSSRTVHKQCERRADNVRRVQMTRGRRVDGERMAWERCTNDCFEKEIMLLNFGENGDEKEKKEGRKKIRDLKILWQVSLNLS